MVKLIKNEIYKIGFYVVIGNFKYIKSFFKDQNMKVTLDDEDKHSAGIHFSFNGNRSVIWLNTKYKEQLYDSLIHELFHMMCFHLDRKGLSLDESSEESYAYFLEWAYRKSIKVLKKWKKRKKKLV